MKGNQEEPTSEPENAKKDVVRKRKLADGVERIENGIANRLNDLLVQHGDTQRKIAQELGVSTATISNIFSGVTHKIDAEFLMKLAKRFNVSATWLYSGEGRKNPNDYVIIPFIDPTVEQPESEPIMLSHKFIIDNKLTVRAIAALRYYGTLSERLIMNGDIAIIDQRVKHIDRTGLFCFKTKGSIQSYQLQYFVRLYDGQVKVYASGSENADHVVNAKDIYVDGKVVMVLRIGAS
ncbi:MAG: helix-turn-helix transcriptional regulator [Magnetococcales bacterium]|nr:helix-turn-helix transcriptional regulator [Magnetococcales bacterium]